MTPGAQAQTFLAMLCCGACLGAVYDLLGILRRIRGLCTIADLLFGLFCAAGIVLTALWRQCDPFRLFTFAGTAFGLVLYGITIGAGNRKIRGFMLKRKIKWEEKYKKRSTAAGN